MSARDFTTGSFPQRTAVTGGGGSFDPNEVTGLVAEFDASLPGMVTASGGLVSQFSDHKGTRHATNGTGAEQPAFPGTKINGLDTIAFTIGKKLTMASAIPNSPPGITSYSVFRRYADNVYMPASTPDGVYIYANKWGFTNNYAGTDTGSTVAINGVYSTCCVNQNDGRTLIIANGVTIYDVAAGGPGQGASQGFVTVMGEVANLNNQSDLAMVWIYAGSHDATTRAQVLNGIFAKWGT